MHKKKFHDFVPEMMTDLFINKCTFSLGKDGGVLP